MEALLTDDFIPFGSRQSLFKEVMETLRDENVTTIGMWGMAGIGKTTLATEVGKRAKDERLFDQVVKAVASQVPNVRIIQGTLADLLKLQLKGASEADRATELSAGIKKCGRILIILDDVWNELNLAAIGIPSGLDHKGCKIVITTRHGRVCDDMCCQRKFTLNVLDYEEALDLFSKHARLPQNSEFRGKAEEIVKECRGLPLAIEVVGSALRNKSLEDYEDAIWRLSHANYVYVESADREIYPAIELSINYLKCEGTVELLFLCSLYPEDSKIFLEDLTRITFGLELFKSVYSVEEARQTTLRRVRELVDACLLLPDNKDWSLQSTYGGNVWTDPVTVHDIVRDVALWLSRKRNNSYLTTPLVKHLRRRHKAATAISIKNCEFGGPLNRELDWPLSERLEYPQLKLLLLKTAALKDDCFEMMSSLQVLVLSFSERCYWEANYALPASLEHLRNLRTISLVTYGSRLCGANIIGKLKSLQILSLGGDCIESLPQEIEELTNLRLLDLSLCDSLEKIPRNVLSNLTALEELNICHDFITGKDLLSEIASLPHLTAFTAEVDNLVLPTLSFRKPLQRFQINSTFSGNPWSRNLSIDTLHCSEMASLQQSFPRVEQLRIGLLVDTLENLLPECFDDPTHLEIRACDLECLIDTTTTTYQPMPLFSNLQCLTLSKATRMTTLCKGPPPPGCFSNLRRAEISVGDRCQNIVPHVIPIGPKMEDLDVSQCKGLKYIFEFDLEDDIKKEMSLLPSPQVMTLHSLPELRGIWKPSHQWETLQRANNDNHDGCRNLTLEAQLRSLNSLRVITISECEKVEEAFVLIEYNGQIYKEQFSNLKAIFLFNLHQLRCIWRGPHQNLNLHKLERIAINSCEKLTSVFTIASATSLHKLRFIRIFRCRALETIIALDMDELSASADSLLTLTILPKLETIEISSCCELKSILHCQKLTSIFVAASDKSLAKLRSIEIVDCRALEAIIAVDMDELSASADSLLTLTIFSELETIEISSCCKLKSILHCQKLTNIFAAASDRSLAKLRSIKIVDCGALESIIGLSMDEFSTSADSSPTLTILPELETIEISSCGKLKSILHCQKLTSIFTATSDRSLAKLQSIKIFKCGALESIIAMRMDELSASADSSLTLTSLPKLETIEISSCGELKSILPVIADALPRLENITIEYCPNLETVIDMVDHEGEATKQLHELFPKLEKICILGCKKVKSVLAFSVAQELPELRILKIIDCPVLEHVFSVDEGNQSAHAKLKEVKLPNSLSLMTIANVQRFRLLTSANLPVSCPRLTEVFLGSKDATEPALGFADTTLRAEPWNCHNFGDTALQFGAASNHFGLKKLVVKDSEVEELFDLQLIVGGSNQEPVSIDITVLLSLCNLPDLECIWKGPSNLINWIRIGNIEVGNCAGLKNSLFPYSIAQKLSGLTTLYVYSCEELEYIIGPRDYSLQDEEQSSSFSDTCLSWLRKIKVEDCESLKFVFPLSVAQGLPSLKEITIKGACRLEQVIGNDRTDERAADKKILFPQLRIVKLQDLPCLRRLVPVGYSFSRSSVVELQEVFIKNCSIEELFYLKEEIECSSHEGHEQGNQSYSSSSTCLLNLQTIRVEECLNLRALFNSTTAGTLAKLNSIVIKNCQNLETIILPKDEGHSANDYDLVEPTWMPLLWQIYVEGCYKLKTVLHLSGAQELSQLSVLHIIDCPVLQQVFKSDGGKHREYSKREIQLPSLSVLRIIRVPRSMHFTSTSHRIICPCLKVVVIEVIQPSDLDDLSQRFAGTTLMEPREKSEMWNSYKFGDFMPWLSALQSSTYLQALKLDNCEIVGESNLQPVLTELEHLSLSGLHDLDCMWKGLASFVNLTNLCNIELRDCVNLRKSLFTYKIAQKLYVLQVLHISNCKELENIIEPRDQNLEDEEEICSMTAYLADLKKVRVEGCENLKFLFPVSAAQFLPSLEEMIVRGASKLERVIGSDDQRKAENEKINEEIVLPKLRVLELVDLPCLSRIFPVGYSLRRSSVAKLQRVLIENCNIEEGFDLKNEFIRLSPEPEVLNLKELYLCNLPKLKSVWKGYIDPCHLQRIVVRNCLLLECIFEPGDRQRLDGEHERWSNFSCSSASMGLWKLSKIEVEDCDGLKYIFLLSIAQELPSIKQISIKGARRLEQLFREDQTAAKRKEILLPELRILELEDLPCLSHILPGGYTVSRLSFPKLRAVFIKNCSIEEVFDCTLSHKKINLGPVFASLTVVYFCCLPNLMHIWKVAYPSAFMGFNKLKSIYVEGCDRLKTIFPEDQYFPALETVHVVGAPTPQIVSNPPLSIWLIFPQLQKVMVDDLASQAVPNRQSAFDSYIEIVRKNFLFDLEDQVEVDVCAAFQAYRDVMEREAVNSQPSSRS